MPASIRRSRAGSDIAKNLLATRSARPYEVVTVLGIGDGHPKALPEEESAKLLYGWTTFWKGS
jgi:hypothetical protein